MIPSSHYPQHTNVLSERLPNAMFEIVTRNINEVNNNLTLSKLLSLWQLYYCYLSTQISFCNDRQGTFLLL
jgi:hypothetical protein